MGRPKKSFPSPFLRLRNKSWQIRWRLEKEEFSISIGERTKDDAKTICAAIAVALAKKDEWPLELVAEPSVKRYLAIIAGNDPNEDDKKLIERYIAHMRSKSKSSWPRTVKAHLTLLR